MEKIKFDKLNSTLFQGVCEKNGLKIIIAPMYEATRVTAGLYIDRGGLARNYSIGSTKIYPGTPDMLVKSLLAEHSELSNKLFEEDVKLNAHVEESFTTISYTADMDKALDLLNPLLHLVDGVLSTNDEIENMKLDYVKALAKSDKEAANMVRNNLYIRSPMGINPHGTAESLKKVHLVAIKRYFESFYKVENMTLIICGNISPEKAHDIANAYTFSAKKPVREIHVTHSMDTDAEIKNAMQYIEGENTLIFGLKLPKREHLFNRFSDHMFSYYCLLKDSIFSSLNTKSSELLKDVVSFKDGGLCQGGEDAFLYQQMEVSNKDECMTKVRELLAESKLISKKDFKTLKTNFLNQQKIIYKRDDVTYFNMLCEDYANRFASQALATAVKTVSYRKYCDFLDVVRVCPVSFIATDK